MIHTSRTGEAHSTMSLMDRGCMSNVTSLNCERAGCEQQGKNRKMKTPGDPQGGQKTWIREGIVPKRQGREVRWYPKRSPKQRLRERRCVDSQHHMAANATTPSP